MELKMVNIPETELMAEKLGMITLCENCGKRLKRAYVARIPCWAHEHNNFGWCDENSAHPYAQPRKSSLANQRYMEPQ